MAEPATAAPATPPATRRLTPAPLTPARPLARPPRAPSFEPALPAPSLPRRVLALAAPWLLLLVVLGAIALGYRLTLFTGTPRYAFARPLLIAPLALLPLLAVPAFHLRRRRQPAMLLSRAHALVNLPQGALRPLARLPAVLRLATVALLLVALARPQHESADTAWVEGIDIVVALDVSQSMAERDIAPDRLRAAKNVLRDVIAGRKSDRIGLVIFGTEAFTQCPLTLDYRSLTGLLDAVELGLINGNTTAIGNAIATALNRLRKSESKSKVIILLTDGDNNAGNVSPQQAARFAQSLGVRIFTILMGSDVGAAADPFAQVRPRHPVNPKLLEEIAGATGGTPYLATDVAALKARFAAILDELDRTRMKDQKGKRRELYPFLLAPALGLLLLEVALSLTRFRRFP